MLGLFKVFLLNILIQWVRADCPVGTQSLPSDSSMCITLATNYDYPFATANSRCFAENGRLSHIANSFDNTVAMKLLQMSDSNSAFFYIGLQRVNGSWRYADDEYGIDPVKFLNWGKGQPAAQGDCAMLSHVDGKWYVGDCGQRLPYLCDVPALNDPLYCTDKLNVDILFMIDDSGDQNDTRMMHDVLFGFNTVLRTQWYQDPMICAAPRDLDKQLTRITGIVYLDDMWMSDNGYPWLCVDRFPEIVDSMRNNTKQNHFVSDLSVPFDVVQLFTESDKCDCRRTDPVYKTKQIMIWMPMRDAYNTSIDISLSQLPSWDHYLWPIRVSKKNATYPMWTDPLMKEIKMPTDHPEFIPTQVLTLWRFLCDLTGSPGETPPAPFI